MNFKDKYLKYKNKYSKLKGGYEKKNILLMFLGGLPSEDNTEIYNHWKSIKECSDISQFKIIVHPINIINYIIPPLWNDFDIHIVDDNHHVGTKWASRSLVDATLLMMQYGRIKFKNIKKYVLLSNTCVPLYNFNNLYEALTENSKSWLMSYSENENSREHLVNIQEVNGGIFNLYERNYFSQWMAIDKIHADYFFIKNEPLTYIIERNNNQIKKIYCKQTNKVIVNPNINQSEESIELSKLLNSFDSFYYDKFNHLNIIQDPCSAIDEHFFGMYIYYKLLHNISIDKYIDCLLENIVTQTDYQIHKKILYLKKYDTELNRSFIENNNNKINVNLNNINTYNNNIINIYPYGEQHVYTPGPYNLNQIKKEYFIKSYESIDNNKYIINQDRNIELKTNNNSKDGKYVSNVVSKNYPVSCTYTDWDSWSPDPFNVLRDCTFSNTNFNIRDYLNINSPIDAINYLIDLNNLDNNINPTLNLDIDSLKIKMPMYHPLEYTEWTLKNIINAYILLSYFNNIFIIPEKKWPKYIFKWAYDSWKNYICDYFNNYNELNYIIKINNNRYSIPFIECLHLLIENSDTNYDSNKKYGCYITPDIFTSAISNGALFIRKSTNNCGISAYTNIVCKLNYNEINNYCNGVIANIKYWNWNIGNDNNRNSSNYKIDEIIKHGRKNNYSEILKILLDCDCSEIFNINKQIVKETVYDKYVVNTIVKKSITKNDITDNNFEYKTSNFMDDKKAEYNIIYNNFKVWLINNYNNDFLIKYNKYFFNKNEFNKLK
jgi:hypothetical protein